MIDMAFELQRLRQENDDLRAELDAARTERDAARTNNGTLRLPRTYDEAVSMWKHCLKGWNEQRAELARMRPVVDAAVAWGRKGRASATGTPEHYALIDAVDAYRAAGEGE